MEDDRIGNREVSPFANSKHTTKSSAQAAPGLGPELELVLLIKPLAAGKLLRACALRTAAFIAGVFSFTGRTITRVEGVLLLLGFVLFVAFTFA